MASAALPLSSPLPLNNSSNALPASTSSLWRDSRSSHSSTLRSAMTAKRAGSRTQSGLSCAGSGDLLDWEDDGRGSNSSSSGGVLSCAAADSSRRMFPMLPPTYEDTLTGLRITSTKLWDTGSTVVTKHVWSLADSAESVCVVEKTWCSSRVYRDCGYMQVASEMRCGFEKASAHGLLVTPLECSLTTADGPKSLSVLYPHAGINLETHFSLMRRAAAPEAFYGEVNRAAVHLLLGLEDVHSTGLVLRDLKSSNALYSIKDKVYRLSDARLACREGSRSSGSDSSRPSADMMRRYGSGRAFEYRSQRVAANTSDLDILALGELLGEVAMGGRPEPIDIDRIGDFAHCVKGYTEEEIGAMEPAERQHVLLEAMYDRAVSMVDDGHWLTFVRRHIAPQDPALADFLSLILRPRERRATVEELLEHPYILRILEREIAHIQAALPAWRQQEEGARRAAVAVKLARENDAMRQILLSYGTPQAASAHTTAAGDGGLSSNTSSSSTSSSSSSSSTSSSSTTTSSTSSTSTSSSSSSTASASAAAPLQQPAGQVDSSSPQPQSDSSMPGSGSSGCAAEPSVTATSTSSTDAALQAQPSLDVPATPPQPGSALLAAAAARPRRSSSSSTPSEAAESPAEQPCSRRQQSASCEAGCRISQKHVLHMRLRLAALLNKAAQQAAGLHAQAASVSTAAAAADSRVAALAQQMRGLQTAAAVGAAAAAVVTATSRSSSSAAGVCSSSAVNASSPLVVLDDNDPGQVRLSSSNGSSNSGVSSSRRPARALLAAANSEGGGSSMAAAVVDGVDCMCVVSLKAAPGGAIKRRKGAAARKASKAWSRCRVAMRRLFGKSL